MTKEHAVASISFAYGGPSETAPIECVCGWTGTLDYYLLHRTGRKRRVPTERASAAPRSKPTKAPPLPRPPGRDWRFFGGVAVDVADTLLADYLDEVLVRAIADGFSRLSPADRDRHLKLFPDLP